MKELIILYEEYIKLLGEELSELVGLARVHGWKSTRFEQGELLRSKIGRVKMETEDAIERLKKLLDE
jgi:hypothetical protein